jgi:heme-degrading monooxygenase HmoA
MSTMVMVFARVQPGTGLAFEAAFREVSSRVRGTDGHLGDRLLRDATDPAAYVLVGEWESIEKFHAWEDSPIHREVTVPMRPFWADAVRRVIYHQAVAPLPAGLDRAGAGRDA